MKKILPIFLLASSVCFSMSKQVEANLMICEQAEKNNHWQSSIDFLGYLIENEEILDIDKIHYLQRRRIIHQISHNVFYYIKDSQMLQEICEKSPECNQEYILNYE
jgi:hypothetical protein